MLKPDEVRTICAALRYWEEEICPHDPGVADTYFAPDENAALTGLQIRDLRQRLATATLRFGLVDSQMAQMHSRDLFESVGDAAAESQGTENVVVAVLIPLRDPQAAS